MESELKKECGGQQVVGGSDAWLDELLTQAEEADELRVTESWLERARWAGTGPDFVKVGRKPYYTRRLNREWLKSQRHVSTRAKAEREATT